MNQRIDSLLQPEAAPLRFEHTSTRLTVHAVDARGLEMLRPLARSAEIAEGVRAVKLYCDRVVVELGARGDEPPAAPLTRRGSGSTP